MDEQARAHAGAARIQMSLRLRCSALYPLSGHAEGYDLTTPNRPIRQLELVDP